MKIDRINELSDIEKINIEKIIDKFGNDFIITNKHNLAYNCPYCSEKRGKIDKDRKFCVELKSTLYWCFKCHTKGIVIKNKASNSEKIIQYLLDYFKIDEQIEDIKNNELLSLENVKEISKNSLAYEYLKNRNITDEQIEYYNLKNGINDDFGRIIIPNLIVSKWTDFYQGRSYLGINPKYKNPEGVDKSNIVFNLQNQNKNQKRIYIVEGIFSAIRAGKDSVCIFGSSISDNQIKSIKKYNFKEIFCCLDGDSAGQIGNLQMAKQLSVMTNSKIYIVKLPETEDPADLGEDLFKEYCEKNNHLFINETINNIFSYFD